ncbi:MAG: isoprenylcysteine carboxylmethyltransferase family protein [Syntrophomonas sp.]|nr:isoprenylcysteine carboxylmethyltransferase family protein [Syntrophomonas sp.]MDD2511128.1 isoprenylcysteine carboxylmethyltransferase family protein [Syntrophomonas sp.]MDD4627206.1 isoprenylcysteine carboxylmethyltransferase family protein [Syntrophomonas sp.]
MFFDCLIFITSVFVLYGDYCHLHGLIFSLNRLRKIPSFLATLNLFGYLIPGLDFRFHWSTVPFWIVIAANVIVFMGYTLIIFVFKENSYAFAVIQVVKEQQVITTGPYAIVRHPMYTGMLLMTLFTALALGSYWALIPSIGFFIPYLVLRIKGEEELLLRDLLGYKEYCIKTRYRLIPSIW